jgi:hypothetical protein
MNIVVTIPKSKLAEVEAEEKQVVQWIAEGKTNIVYYWTMAKLPKHNPTRIYFVWNNAIRAYHEVLYLANNRVYMRTEIHNLKTPIPMQGFRGWKYFDKEAE